MPRSRPQAPGPGPEDVVVELIESPKRPGKAPVTTKLPSRSAPPTQMAQVEGYRAESNQGKRFNDPNSPRRKGIMEHDKLFSKRALPTKVESMTVALFFHLVVWKGERPPGFTVWYGNSTITECEVEWREEECNNLVAKCIHEFQRHYPDPNGWQRLVNNPYHDDVYLARGPAKIASSKGGSSSGPPGAGYHDLVDAQASISQWLQRFRDSSGKFAIHIIVQRRHQEVEAEELIPESSPAPPTTKKKVKKEPEEKPVRPFKCQHMQERTLQLEGSAGRKVKLV